jgi:SSS family solute:Na+ symporter/sodium/pantothenate symporter
MNASFWSSPLAIVACAYLAILVYLGWEGYRRRQSNSLGDFYLAGSSLGFVVLFATLYATQYSGNTFLGYTGQAYRIGFAWVMSVGMMMSVIIIYLLFAPRLHELAHRHGYVTPADWFQHRFHSRSLTMVVSLIMALSLLNYLYAQFLAMGHFVAGMTGGEVPFWAGVVGLGIVIGVYETLGGMRSVAWTDVVQGFMLFSGLMLVLLMAWPQIGGLGAVAQQLQATKPDLVRLPPWWRCGNWVSWTVLLGFGAAVYPHAIQRIYAARDARTLRRSLKIMVWMPFFTTFPVFLVGIAAHGVIAERTGIATDQVMPAFLAAIGGGGPAAEWAAAFVSVATLAAIMSTADSALLSLSSILTVDIFARLRGRQADSRDLAHLGKWISWAILVVLVLMATNPPARLLRLIEIKMELLIQVAPILILGIRYPELRTETAWRALILGSSVVAVSLLFGVGTIGGIHPGTYAFAANAIVCWAGIRAARAQTAVP